MTVATTALDVALAVLTSPITLVIAGLAALAAGIIYAYKHSETFRNIVDAMWAT
jgi:phage-related protein